MVDENGWALVDALANALVRSAPSAIVALDKEGRITTLNVHAQRLLGAGEEAVGRPYQGVFGSSPSDRLVGLFLRSARGGESTEPHLLRATLPTGRRVELRASVGPIRDLDGTISGLLFVADESQSEERPSPEQIALANRMRAALRAYLGEEIASMVEARPSFISVGGVRRRVSLLHADMRGYTTRAEHLEPEDTTTLLLKYHGKAIEALQHEGATLDRFIGDSVLAIWNAPADCELHARAAIRGALALQQATREVGEDLAYGIGVHTGDAVVGNIGGNSFQNYTAVGDTVNVAARLQEKAAPGQVLCSRAALDAAGDGVRATPVGALVVKGRREPIEAFAVTALAPAGATP